MSKFALGDLAYYVFRPVVYAVDAVWGTDLKDCDKCKQRRRKWNALPYSRVLAWVVVAGVVAVIWGVI